MTRYKPYDVDQGPFILVSFPIRSCQVPSNMPGVRSFPILKSLFLIVVCA
jgi:hypothetical protein